MPDGVGSAPPTDAASDGPLPTVNELRASIRHAESATLERRFARRFSSLSVEAQEKYEHLLGLRDHYKHKGRWSNFLMLIMAAMVVYQSVLLGMVGAGLWDFSKYEWLLPALLVQNLAQIIGLAVFVVKALFKDMKG